MVLGVLLINKKLIHAQAVYRMSLALADLLVGIAVFPSFIYISLFYFSGRLTINKQSTSTSLHLNQSIEFNTFLNTVLHSTLSQKYINAMGVFTVVSTLVSVKTLTIAAIDRFAAIYRPLRYHTLSPTKIARNTCLVIWMISFVVALLPISVEQLNYTIKNTSLVFVAGNFAMIVYMLTLCIPLILVWCFTFATFAAYKSHSSNRKYIISNITYKSEISQHMKLLSTLGIIAGAFTVTLIPLIVFLSYLFLGDMDFYEILNLNPKNPVNFFPLLQNIVIILFLSSSLSNFFVYSVRDKKFRFAIKTIGIKIICKLKSCLYNNNKKIVEEDVSV